MKITYDSKTKEVHERDVLIGHVVRRARVAAGTKGSTEDRGTLAAGTRKHFWTAVPVTEQPFSWGLGWEPGRGGSIGTRFKTAEDAVEALAVWHTAYGYLPLRDVPEPWSVLRKRRWGF